MCLCMCVCVLLNNRLASQQNQKAERLMWSDKATGLGIAAGCDTSWISSPERLIQERRLTQGVQGSLLQPDTLVEIIMYTVYVRFTLIPPASMQLNALLSCEHATLQSTCQCGGGL